MAADVTRILGDRLVSVVAYGPATAAVFATDITADDLHALSVLVEAWHKDGLATPLVLTTDEFHRSLDAFPLEYQAMLDRHAVIAGRDPLADVRIRPDDLRRACETHARGHLLHLRQGWLEAAGHEDRLADLIARSAPPLRALLGNVMRLSGTPASGPDALAEFAAKTIGMPGDLVQAVLAAEAHPDRRHSLVPRLGEYLDAAERLWAFVDQWRRP